MPRTVKRPPNTETDEIPYVTVPDEDADVEKILQEVGDDAKYVSLSRYSNDLKKYAYVDKIPRDEFDLEEVKLDYGGGKYRGRIYGETGFLRQVSFSIDPRFLPRAVPPPTANGGGTAPSEFGEIKDLLRQLLLSQQTPRHDPMDMAIRLAEVLRGGTAPAPAPAPSVGFSEMFSIFKEGMSLGQAAQGGDSYLPVIERLGGPLIETLKTMATKPKETVARANNGVRDMMPPKPLTPEDLLKQYLPQLIGLAASKKDPALYAEFVLDQVPESAYDFLAQTSSRPDVIFYLAGLNGDVKNHEAWFLDFTSAIQDLLTEDATDAEDEAKEPMIRSEMGISNATNQE